MRKIARKTTSLALVLMLLLSAMSVAAFASNEVQICAACTHPRLMTTWYSGVYQNDANTHIVEDFYLYNCPDCIYSNKVVESTVYEAHDYDEYGVCTLCHFER